MEDELSHTVTIKVDGNYPHGQRAHTVVTVSGDGGFEHMLCAFKASLIAAGFGASTISKMDSIETK